MRSRGVRPLGLWLIAVMAVTGCAGLDGPRRRDCDAGAIARAYEEGVRDGAARLAAEREAELADPWMSPLVEEVWMPARVVGGVLIPAHREWVVIHPAGWRPAASRERDTSRAAPGCEGRGRP